MAQAWTDSQYKSFRTLLYGSFTIHVLCMNSLKKEKKKEILVDINFLTMVKN